ncbi:MAG TPA: response regulator [Gammaproteobacteria bacterium]|nr:response regulator [Gammaproteobacteria bacterium]
MKTILVVDDEFGIVDVLLAALEDEGYRVLTASNGRRAMERLAENVPDLIIMDFMMPLLDGAEAGKAIRGDPATASIPIIMMSALPEPAVRKRFDGYQIFLRKPFLIPALLESMAAVFQAASR